MPSQLRPAPNMVDLVSTIMLETPHVSIVSITAPSGVPVAPQVEGWKLFVSRGVNISWTVAGRKIGTGQVVRAERLSKEMVESFDPEQYWRSR